MKKTAEKPLSCPCCGGKSRIKHAVYNTLGAYGTPATQKEWWGVYCTECHLSQPARTYETKEDAVEHWNTRFPASP